MQSLGDLIQRPDALDPDCPCGVALARFDADPGLVVLAVARAGKPVGALSRLALLGRRDFLGNDLTVGDVMDAAPVILCADSSAAEATRELLEQTPGALIGGFLVVDDEGRYRGVGTAVDLMPRHDSTAAHPAGTGGIASRFCEAVREPISAAVAAAERLRGQQLSANASRDIDIVSENGAEVLRLLEAIGQLSRAQDDNLAIVAEPHRLADLMDDIEACWRRPAQRRGLTLMVSYDGPPDCSVRIDRARFMHMFDALIAHALAHTRTGVVEASLKTEAADDGWRLACRVRDNGGRQDADYLRRLFDAAAVDGPAGGMGVQLGLALASRVVSAMGGALTAKSNAGPGITIGFEVAVAAAAAAAAQEQLSASQPIRERLAHVLIVEDNATNRMVIETLCEMIGCSSESVVDGVEAVEAARVGRYDVILMDIKMPRMDGLTATAEIRKLPGQAGAAPIIALTANADPEDMRRYIAAGMCRVVEKPIKADRFAEAITAALNAAAETGRHAAAA
jgi:CheY-like chemotaxis protein